MSQLIVVGFKDVHGASEVLKKLRALDNDWVVDLEDAIAVYRDYKGKLRVDDSYQMTARQGAAWGALWGSLPGATLAIPFAAGPIGAAAVAETLAVGAAAGGAINAAIGAVEAGSCKEEFGIRDEFIKDIENMVQPGDSAILALLRTADPFKVAEQFRGFGGTVLQTTLSKEQSAKLQSVLQGSEGRSASTS